jgi:hypothetical protein
MANNFLQQDLLKRISMMMKNKTNSAMKCSYAIGLPLLAVAMILLSVPKLNATVSDNESDRNSPTLSGKEIIGMNEVYDPSDNSGSQARTEKDYIRMDGLSTDTAKNREKRDEKQQKQVKISWKGGR